MFMVYAYVLRPPASVSIPGSAAPVSIVILYCFCYYCMTMCAKFINNSVSSTVCITSGYRPLTGIVVKSDAVLTAADGGDASQP